MSVNLRNRDWQRTALVGVAGRGHVAALDCGEIKDIPIPARAEQDRIPRVAANLAGHHIPDDDPLGVAVHQNEIEHLGPREHLDLARGDLRAQGLIGAQQKLLSSLPASLEGARNLCAAEGAVASRPPYAGKELLCNALVVMIDDRESVNIRFTRAKISLDGVIEETIRTATVV
jgi:hypothetical protein